MRFKEGLQKKEKISFNEVPDYLRNESLLDVLTQYEILGFCGLGLNRLKFCRIKSSDMCPTSRVLMVTHLFPQFPILQVVRPARFQ